MPSLSNLKPVITLATGAAVAYLIALLLKVRLEMVYALYGVAACACIWMTIRILKDPYSTDKKFDDYFYQDRPDIRRVGKE